MKIGYARVSTEEQNPDLQIEALELAGCKKIYCDRGISAVGKKRPEFEKALAEIGEGDILTIWKFDRAFRSLLHALEVLEGIEKKKAGFCSITEQIDTSTAHGRLVFQITNAMAEFERGLISERTKAGIQSAKAHGKKMGRPVKLTSKQVQDAKGRKEGGETMGMIAKSYNISRSTLYEYFRKYHDQSRKTQLSK